MSNQVVVMPANRGNLLDKYFYSFHSLYFFYSLNLFSSCFFWVIVPGEENNSFEVFPIWKVCYSFMNKLNLYCIIHFCKSYVWSAVIKCLFFGYIMSIIRIYSSVVKGLDVSLNLLNYGDSITYSMEQSSSGQQDSLSGIWGIPCLLWRPEVHVHLHMNLFKDQTNPFFILTVFI